MVTQDGVAAQEGKDGEAALAPPPLPSDRSAAGEVGEVLGDESQSR